MNSLKYNKPAKFWEEALPLGNGRIGAMIYGGITKEQIDLNEDTLWSGQPGNETGYKIKENIQHVRELLSEKKYSEALPLTNAMTGAHDTQTYQMAGRLFLDFGIEDGVVNYENKLQLDEATSTTRFNWKSVNYLRESFLSEPNQVLAMRLSADSPGAISFRMSMESQLKSSNRIDANNFMLIGQAPFCNYSRRGSEDNGLEWERDGLSGMKYIVKTKLLLKGGSSQAQDGFIEVSDADEVILFLTIKTGFKQWDKNSEEDVSKLETECDQRLERACKLGWQGVRNAHKKDFKTLYSKMDLDLKVSSDKATDELLKAGLPPEENTALANLVFNYGRYLLISSSRMNTQPANLQGIWNDKLIAPWRSNYTTNINLEMNYWPAETCNLADCAEPLLTMVGELSESGKRAAGELYGARGWCLHHNCDLWRYPYTGGSQAQHAFWPVGGAWVCQHVWEHYAFSRDKEFLAQFLPIMKGAAAFLLDFMVENSVGKLTTSPSTSPENQFIDPQTGEQSSVCEGSAMDLTMIRELFENILEGSNELNLQDALTDEVKAAYERLDMPTIGKDGRLLEFGIEAEEPQPSHRHISHLYGVYPGWMFSPERMPEYYEACRKSLDARGDLSTGWAMGWRVAMWARFRDGNRALQVIGNLMTFLDSDPDAPRMGGGGLYSNLWDAHPPFQIDGNFGVTAGIAEMLLQSHQKSEDGKIMIELLPALPDAWQRGNVFGLRARGGVEVSFTWENGKVKELTLTPSTDGLFELHFNDQKQDIDLKAGKELCC